VGHLHVWNYFNMTGQY